MRSFCSDTFYLLIKIILSKPILHRSRIVPAAGAIVGDDRIFLWAQLSEAVFFADKRIGQRTK
jgi:hypothetical protein